MSQVKGLVYVYIRSCQQNPIKVDKLIDFGDVMVNSSEVRRVIVSNLSGSLPIKISFDQMSNFSTHPKSISIPPGCQEIVNVIFAPRQGGQLRNVLLTNQKPGKFLASFDWLIKQKKSKMEVNIFPWSSEICPTCSRLDRKWCHFTKNSGSKIGSSICNQFE